MKLIKSTTTPVKSTIEIRIEVKKKKKKITIQKKLSE